MQQKWTEIRQNLKKMLEPGIFQIWVEPLAAEISNTRIIIFAPNSYMRDWVRKRLEPAMRQAASRVLAIAPEKLELIFDLREEGNPAKEPVQCANVAAEMLNASRKAACQTLPLGSDPISGLTTWQFSFEDFVIGASNQLAVAAAKELGKSGSVRTLFVNAGSGLGKTHLAQAAGQCLAASGSIKAAYLTADQFASRYVACMREKKLEDLKQYLCGLDALVLEDVHFLQRKKVMQEMLLNIVKRLQEKGARVIFTSSFATKELRDIDSQLISHFCSGILTGMDKPGIDMRREILRRKAKSYQVNLPDEICDVLSQRISTDIRQLESCLANMIFKARLLNSGLSLDLALETVSQYAAVDPVIDMPSILRLVCESFGITEKQLCSKSRRQEFVAGRNTAYYLARKHTDMSLEEIGCIFNRRHSTVMRGITQVEEEMAKESTQGRQFAQAVAIIEKRCGLTAR